MTLTGACVLNGATVGTDKWIFALYDSSGALLANTAIAGVTTATASKYQCIAFTATVQVAGPMSYYIAVQGNGTTDTFSLTPLAACPQLRHNRTDRRLWNPRLYHAQHHFHDGAGPLMMAY